MTIRTPTYCTPEDVADFMDMPVAGPDPDATQAFTPYSHPSYNQVVKMILANEDSIDRRINRSWRENQVKNRVFNIPTYRNDENGYRTTYYSSGGNVIQLHKYIREWNPDSGDRLEVRNWQGQWCDMTGNLIGSMSEADEASAKLPRMWFDYEDGRLFLKTLLCTPKDNAIRISYRWGEDPESMPDAIPRLCVLKTALNVLDAQMYNIKLGMGGDMSGLRDSIRRAWQEEINEILSSFQRTTSVRGMIQG